MNESNLPERRISRRRAKHPFRPQSKPGKHDREIVAQYFLPREPSAEAEETKDLGRFAQFNAFVDETMRSFRSAAALKVWVVLFRDARPNGIATASQEWIARRAGVDVRSVKRGVRDLKALGLLEVRRKGGTGRGASTYRVHARPLPNGSAPPGQGDNCGRNG